MIISNTSPTCTFHEWVCVYDCCHFYFSSIDRNRFSENSVYLHLFCQACKSFNLSLCMCVSMCLYNIKYTWKKLIRSKTQFCMLILNFILLFSIEWKNWNVFIPTSASLSFYSWLFSMFSSFHRFYFNFCRLNIFLDTSWDKKRKLRRNRLCWLWNWICERINS